MECYSNQHVYITLKDHGENFINKVKCRLINLSKSKVGCVSKSYLNTIIADLSCKTKVNQLSNAVAVINWFKNLSDKHNCKFIKFDIGEFYTSISENLLNKSVEYAKGFTKIEGNAINAIVLARKSLFF